MMLRPPAQHSPQALETGKPSEAGVQAEIMRCSDLIPLSPELPLLIKREAKLLAAFRLQVAQLEADGWEVTRRSTTESPLTASYRLIYQFRRTESATG